MSAAVYSVPYLMTQSDYERFVTGTSFSEISEPPIDFAVDEPVISVMRDEFWVLDKDVLPPTVPLQAPESPVET